MFHFRVRLGENYLYKRKDCDSSGLCAPPLQDIRIKNFVIHNKYCRTYYVFDYGLIELEKPAVLNGNLTVLSPISLVMFIFFNNIYLHSSQRNEIFSTFVF